MDQDLTLMEQLLNLNETIEDIKVKRLYGSSRESFYSSCDLNSGSDWSLPDSPSGCFRGSRFFPGTATVDMSSTENIAGTGKNRKNAVQVDSGYNSPWISELILVTIPCESQNIFWLLFPVNFRTYSGYNSMRILEQILVTISRESQKYSGYSSRWIPRTFFWL
jgi:hypothetical protein